MYRRAILVGVTVLISLSTLFGLFPQIAYADAPSPYIVPSLLTDAKTMGEAESLAICMEYDNGYAIDGWSGSHSELTPEQVASGKWLRDSSTQYRMWNSYFSGGINCHDLDVNQAVSDIGWTSKVQAVCDLGMTRENKSDCVNGDGNFQWNGANKNDTINRIFKVYHGGYFDGNKDYVRALNLLQQDKVCKINLVASVATATADQKAQAGGNTIDIVGADGTVTKTYYTLGKDSHSAWGYNSQSSEDYIDDKDCNFLVGKVNSNSGTYSTWVKQNQPGSANNAGTCEQYATLQTHDSGGDQAYHDKLLAACQAGQTNKSDAGFCNKTYPPVTAGPPDARGPTAETTACEYGRDTAKDSTSSTTGPNSADNKPTCGIEGIGWLVCPVMNFMAKVNDAAYNFLASYFLTVDTKLVTESEPAWAKFRDIANVAFVIAILFVVYSQISSVGISNYGIKRMLPRIIVAALLVNISFYICAAAVDLSNLLGYAIPQFFGNIPIGAGLKDSGGLATLGSGLSWVLVIGGVVAAAVGVALAVSVPVLLAALLAIGLIVLMLVGRQAFIVLLIVISPLAFVAYLLPNTEQWFKKWYKAFFALLMLFPVVGTVFGASKMAALIINNAGGGSEKVITQLIALAVSAVPFFVVPSLLKGSLAAAGTLGAKLQGMANKSTGKIGARVKDSSRLGTGLADMKKFRDSERAAKYAKGRGTGIMAGVARIPGMGGKKYNERARTRGSQLELAEHEEDVKAAGQDLAANRSYSDINEIATGLHDNGDGTFSKSTIKATDHQREAAIRHMMEKGNFSERQAVLQSAGTMNASQRKSAVNAAYAKGDGGIYGSKTLGDIMDAKDGDAVLNNVAQHLDNGTTNRINSGEIAPEAFTRDTYTSGYVANQAANASADGQNKLAQSLSDYAATDQGKKATSATQADVQRVIGAAPTTPAPPQTQQAAPQQAQPAQNPTQLNIPHSGGTPPVSPPPASPPSGAAPHASSAHTPPGTSNYQQRSNGLWVPPGSGGGTPPSTP